MTLASLFGVSLARLYAAIASVESDNGRTSCNVYQITNRYVEDVNRIIRKSGSSEPQYAFSDVYDRAKSERMMEVYWAYYGNIYKRGTGRNPTAEVLARIHNGGPRGWMESKTVRYWTKARRIVGK